MSTEALSLREPLSPFEQLRDVRDVIQIESQALKQLAGRLDTEFCRAAELVAHCAGNVIVTGIGKAGLVGAKLSATLASTGTRSHFLHAAEAMHGDLGCIGPEDVMLVLSQSGETEEIVRLVPSLLRMGVAIVAITARSTSSLGKRATVTLELGALQEACPLGLAPSTSTTAMLALGDALALVASRMRGFRREDFARLHPGGSLGRNLSRVQDHMRPQAQCRVASQDCSVREVLVEVSRPGRRSGAIMLVEADGSLSGLFTDSDLARLFETRQDSALDRPICEVMTRAPQTVPAGAMMLDAVSIMAERKISELPVVDAARTPLGLLDITDVVALFPEALR